MSSRSLFLLSPYRPPTSYPVSLADGEAAAWLNGYAALWHPASLQGAAQPPEAASTYDHDLPKEGAVYCTAEGPSLYQPEDWIDRVRNAHAVSFTATADRVQTFDNLLAGLRDAGHQPADHTDEIVSLFTAIGFGYLTVETWFD